MTSPRYLLYARKSEEDKNRQVQSIGDQIKELRALASRRGLHIVTEIREEHSAKAPGRPQFNAMLDALRRGEADGILTWSINRLLRNPVDHGSISWMLQQGQIASLVTMDKEYLPGDNVVLLSVESAVANQFILDLRKGTLRGLASKIEKGWFPHKAPLGYLNNVVSKTIEPDPERYELLRRAWQMLLGEGRTVTQILHTLNEEWGFRTPPGRGGQRGAGQKPLSRNTLYRVFSNLFYAGYFLHNGQIHKGAHEPMVSLEEFARAKALWARSYGVGQQKHALAFAGLLRCGRCGGAVTAEKHTKTLKATGRSKTYSYYRCVAKNGRCDKRGVSEEALVAQIDALLAGIAIPSAFREWGLCELERWRGQEQRVRQRAHEQKQSELTALSRQLDTLLELRLKEVIGDEEYTRKRNELTLMRETSHAQVNGRESQGDPTRETLRHLLSFCSNARLWFAMGDGSTRRLIAQALGARYELQGREVRIEPHPLLLPILGNDWLKTREPKTQESGTSELGTPGPGILDQGLSGPETQTRFQVGQSEPKREFEPPESGCGSCQKGVLERGCSGWGRTWNQVRTLAQKQSLQRQSVNVEGLFCQSIQSQSNSNAVRPFVLPPTLLALFESQAHAKQAHANESARQTDIE